MKVGEIVEGFRFAKEAMVSNKLRAMLSSLGVVIGISFVIMMGWILSGLDKAVEDTFNIIGSDMLYVDKWDWAGGANWKDLQARKNISLNQAEELISRIKSADIAVPVARKFGAKLKYGSDTYQGMSFEGTTANFALTPGGAILEGRFFNAFEDYSSANVCVVGHKVFETLFPFGNGVGKTIKIDGKKFVVIGVVTKQGTLLMDFVDNVVYMPLSTFLGSFGKQYRSLSIAVKAGNIEKLDMVRDETKGLMRIIRNLKPDQKDDFSINETKAFESSVATLRAVVWGVGIGMTALSFLVGIIGIMNIMFVSVTERTKEIGIRKAIGAKKRSIWIQFIIESLVLCFMGALFAFVICSIIVFLIGTYLPQYNSSFGFLSKTLPYELLLIATLVSLVVGVLAGIIPAARAANLDPVEALRYE